MQIILPCKIMDKRSPPRRTDSFAKLLFTRSIGANFVAGAYAVCICDLLHHASGLFQRGTCLRHDQLVVNAFLLEQLNVRAALGNLAVVND